MAKFYPMFSGSDGNSTYIGNSEGGVLVDAGVSFKRIKHALQDGGISLSDIKAVLITHEHSDHIKGLKILLKNISVPVIASRDTIYALEFAGAINFDTPRIYIDELGEHTIGTFKFKRFPTSHDCKGSSCFRVSLDAETDVAVCTDLGIMTEEIKTAFAGCRLVMLESNHDPVMLRMGPYPAELKVRIASDHGHLSNGVCAETLAHFYTQGTTRFVLAHLSEANNDPEKAASLTRAALMDKGAAENRDYILYVARKEGNRVIPL